MWIEREVYFINLIRLTQKIYVGNLPIDPIRSSFLDRNLASHSIKLCITGVALHLFSTFKKTTDNINVALRLFRKKLK